MDYKISAASTRATHAVYIGTVDNMIVLDLFKPFAACYTGTKCKGSK